VKGEGAKHGINKNHQAMRDLLKKKKKTHMNKATQIDSRRQLIQGKGQPKIPARPVEKNRVFNGY